MDMLFKSIELQGYKTFANKTVFEFPGAITAIVGPNGSGKSNIADAVRWVLGEQSYSLLRGRKTVDMIFSGSEERSRAGMASASILFDNRTNWLPIEFSEVSITRRAYRDGTNEYLINGQRVRLRDVTELLANSGLSERTYTIIGQGLVDTALALKAEERRKLIEEAAGIGLYRSRREEAQRRLETTRRNLERVEDILSELRPRLISLERQAQRSQKHQQIKEDLRGLLREWYGYYWYRTQRELRAAQVDIRSKKKSLDGVREEYETFDQKIGSLRENIKAYRSKLESSNQELIDLQKRREVIERELAVTGERRRSLIEKQNEYDKELARLSDQANEQKSRLNAAMNLSRGLSNQLAESRKSLDEVQQRLSTKEPEWGDITTKIEELRKSLEGLLDKRSLIKGQMEERKIYLEQQRGTLEKIGRELNDAKRSLQGANDDFDRAESICQQTSVSLQAADQTVRNLDKKIDRAELDRQRILDQRNAQDIELARLSAELKTLERTKNKSEDFALGNQILIEAVSQNRLSGVVHPLRDYLKVPNELKFAITAVLEEYLQGVILTGNVDTEQFLQLLEEELADGILLPKEGLNPGLLPELEYGDSYGVVGIASELVEIAPQYKRVVDALLSQVVIVRDRDVARNLIAALSQKGHHSYRVVTLRGEVYDSSGVIAARYSLDTSDVERSRQHQKLIDQIESLEKDNNKLNRHLEALDDRISSLENERIEAQKIFEDTQKRDIEATRKRSEYLRGHDEAKQKLHWLQTQYQQRLEEIKKEETKTTGISNQYGLIETEIEKIREQIEEQRNKLESYQMDDYKAELSHWETNITVTKSSLDAANQRVEDQKVALENVRSRVKVLENRLKDISSSLLELGEKRAELRRSKDTVMGDIDAKQATIKPLEDDLRQGENELIDLRKVEAQARKDLNEAERNYSLAQLELKRRQEELKSLRERIEHDFGLVEFEYVEEISGPTPLPLDGFVEQLPMVHNLSEGLGDTIKRLRGQLHRIGAVNPEAQKEYEEVKERFDFMTGQVNDLKKAEIDVQKVIRELDNIMEREFLSTFDRVSMEFQGLFTRLFGGGSARILLTSPDDLMSTGVAIEARLPGRRTHGLSLLSGGERSLTATALIFALLKISPTPFCILDEVDAMLDEANIGRFSEILRELSEDTQFIIITHNRNTVQNAEVIYGVTMGKDSTSQVISLKLDEVAGVVQ